MAKLNYRELGELLRNPTGAYFDENTPAMLALEVMIDTTGVAAVLDALADISHGKAEHLRQAWQDERTARAWDKQGRELNRQSARKCWLCH